MFALILVVLLQIFVTIQAQNNAIETQTLFNEIFGDNEAKFTELMNSTFRNLDIDKDGNIRIDQISMDKLGEGAQDFKLQLTQALRSVDTNNDGQINKQEYSEALMNRTKSVVLTKDEELCERVEDVVDPCTRGVLFSFKNITTTINRRDTKVLLKSCENGYNSLRNFTAENCILSVAAADGYKKGSPGSCMAIKQCINEYFGYSSTDTRIQDISYTLRGSQMSNTAFLIFALIFIIAPLAGSLFAVLVSMGSLFAALVAIGFQIVWSVRMANQGISYSNLLNDYLGDLKQEEYQQNLNAGTIPPPSGVISQ